MVDKFITSPQTIAGVSQGISTILDTTTKVNVIATVSGAAPPALSDTLLTDTSGTLFVARDNGTAITYVNASTGATYTPVSTVQVSDTLAMGVDGTGITPPTGGTGVRGWLSGLYNNVASMITTPFGKAVRVVIVDPTSGNGSLVQAFHNSDNQTIGGTSYGIMTGGVDQLVNAAGNLDRKRGVWGDAQPATGLASEVPLVFNGTTYDRLRGDATNGLKVQIMTQPAVTGKVSFDLTTPGTTNKVTLGADVVSTTDNIAQIGGAAVSLGQKVMATSIPVALASDQRVAVDIVVSAVSTDRSGTITVGGTAQSLMPTNAARRGIAVQNQSTSDLWINTLGTATASQPSLRVAAGVYYETPPTQASPSAVSVFGATTGQSFYSREW